MTNDEVRSLGLSLALSYFKLARNYFDLDRKKYEETMAKVLSWDPGFRPYESPLYNAAQRFLGLKMAECMASRKRRLVARWRKRSDKAETIKI